MQHGHKHGKKHTPACKGTLPIITRSTVVAEPFDPAVHKFLSKIYGPQWRKQPWRSETWQSGTDGQSARKTSAHRGTL